MANEVVFHLSNKFSSPIHRLFFTLFPSVLLMKLTALVVTAALTSFCHGRLLILYGTYSNTESCALNNVMLNTPTHTVFMFEFFICFRNPSSSAVLKIGENVTISWVGNCAILGASARTVPVELREGYLIDDLSVTSMGTLDCSSNNSTDAVVTVPSTLTSGTYTIQVLTDPNSYSASFEIIGLQKSVPEPSNSGVSPERVGGVTAVAAAKVAIFTIAFINFV